MCMTCYRSHLQILKEAPVSTDSDLLALIDTLKGCVPAIEHVKNIDDIINKAMYTTAIHVGERLLQQESLLLPSVHETFCVHVSGISHAANIDLGQDETGLVTARWIISNLVVTLQHHVSYACRVKKLGTLLYRNLTLPLLIKAAHIKANHMGKDSDISKQESPSYDPAIVYDNINSCIHKQIQKNLSADLKTPYSYDKFDVDKLVSETDPELWNFITSITRSTLECKGYNPRTNGPSTLSHHVKKVQQLFCLCFNVLYK